MGDALTWSQLGTVIGGMAVGAGAGGVFLVRHLAKEKKKETSKEHAIGVHREEFNMAMAELRIRIEESHVEAREARAAANATQLSLTTIGQMIETSMRSLGDRLEGALRDVKDRVDDHAEEITEHHGRLRAVETELKFRRED